MIIETKVHTCRKYHNKEPTKNGTKFISTGRVRMVALTGAALILGLIVLTALTLLGLSGMRTAQVEERMAGNFRDRSLAVRSRMITRNFYEELRLLSVPVLERLEGCFVAQVFLRDVVIIQVDEAFESCLE